jgi:hypothetical protein
MRRDIESRLSKLETEILAGLALGPDEEAAIVGAVAAALAELGVRGKRKHRAKSRRRGSRGSSRRGAAETRAVPRRRKKTGSESS